jgi:hypothetical protein
MSKVPDQKQKTTDRQPEKEQVLAKSIRIDEKSLQQICM